MFATIAGGYSRRPNPGLPDNLGRAEADLLEGRIDAAGYRDVADDYVREILNEMAVIELGIVGDGGVRSSDRALPWITGLEGLSVAGVTKLPDGEQVSRPAATGAVRWTEPVTVRDWQFADSQTDLFVKQMLLGPYTLAALAEPAPGRRRERLAIELGETLNAELHALAAAGCPMIEIDEPLAMTIADDGVEWLTFRAAGERLVAGLDAEGSPHLSLGLWGGQLHPAGFASLLDLPYKSYLVDVLPGPSAWRFIAAVPPERGVIAGVADVQTITLTEHEVIVWAMAWAAQGERGSNRVGVAPNGSLSFIDRHFAHRKAQRLGEAVKIGSMGPIQEVAEALDENPLQSKIAELRTMAQAVEAGRSS